MTFMVEGRRPGAPLTNWAGNVVFGAQRVHRPRSLAELQQVVSGAERVRAVGTGHSFNRIVDSAGDLVSVAGLPRELEVDSASSTVRVSGGTRFGELVGPLHEAGFALHNLGSLPHISVAGAVSTGTHGSGVRHGTLSSAVTAVELVTADGSLRRLSRTDDADRFDGCVVALGGLGVVTTLELAVQPTYRLRQHVYEGLPLATLHERFDEVVSAGYSVSVFWDWRSDRVGQVWRRRLVVDADTEVEGSETTAAPHEWMGASAADGPRHPLAHLSGSVCTEQLGVPGPWHARLPCFRLEFTPSSGEELQSEWFVRREDAVAALRALQPLRDRIAAVLQVGEIRTIAADRLWLSPSADRDTAALHFTWVRDEGAVGSVVAAVDELLSPFGARPHWGKLFATAPELLRQRWAAYEQFERLLRDADPSGTFRNPMLDACFPGARR